MYERKEQPSDQFSVSEIINCGKENLELIQNAYDTTQESLICWTRILMAEHMKNSHSYIETHDFKHMMTEIHHSTNESS